MSRTLEISDQVYEGLADAARQEGLSGIDELLARVSEGRLPGDRQDAVARVRSLRQRLLEKYGEQPDSTALIREDRDSSSTRRGTEGRSPP